MSVAAERGKITCVLGRNGVGKSSLLRAIVGHQPVSARPHPVRRPGHHPLQGLRARAARHRLRAAGPRDLSAADGAREPRDRLCPPAARRAQDLGRAVRAVPGAANPCWAGAAAISPAASSSSWPSPARWSTQPQLLVLDEPTEGIQPSIIKDIGRAITYLREQGKMAILLVEQYFDFARALADTYAVMERGEVVLAGEGAEHGRKRRSALPYRLTVAAREGIVVGAAGALLAATHGRVGSARTSRAGASSTRARRPASGRRRARALSQARARARPRGRAAQHGRRADRRRPHRHRGDARRRRRAPTVTTAAAEKIYRARDGEAADRRRACARRRRAGWPGCRSRPSCSTGLGSIGAPRSTWRPMRSLLAVEMLIFGRAAMGEDVRARRLPRRLAGAPRRRARVRRCASARRRDRRRA